MEYFVSPQIVLEQIDAEQRHKDRQSALVGEALRSSESRPGVRHVLAVAFRDLAAKIEAPSAAVDAGRIVTQS